MFKYILNVSAFKKRCFVCLFLSLNRSPQAASRQGREDVAGDSGLEGEIGGGGGTRRENSVRGVGGRAL